jgi:hypothetical protein
MLLKILGWCGALPQGRAMRIKSMFLLLAEVVDRSPIGTNENIFGLLVVMPELVAALPSPVGGTGFKNLINLRVGSVFGKLDGDVEVAASVPPELMNQIIMNLSAS